jgi:competence protein ComEA
MTSKPSRPTSPLSPWFLRRIDQAGVAVLVVLGLVATAGWWLSQGGWQGRCLEVDRAEPKRAQFQVDVNEAQWPELAQLPDVGETLARRIVQSRQQDGPFLDHEDLRRVKGIGPKTLESIRPYLLPMPDARAVAER